MGWLTWSKKPQILPEAGRLVGLDINSSRARAVIGTLGRPLRRLLLEDPHEDLPLVLSLEKQRGIDLGRPALAVSRKLPHLLVRDFLPALGTVRLWQNGRHRLDAAVALGYILERLRTATSEAEAITLAVPIYLTPTQVKALIALAERAKLPVRGSAAVPLLIVAAAERPWQQNILVVDADEHALTGVLIRTDATMGRVKATTVMPHLALPRWKDCLLNALADRCIRACRRDPRDLPDAEQMLYDQFDDALDRVGQGQRVDLTLRWGNEARNQLQTLSHSSEDFEAYCAALARQTLAGLAESWTTALPGQPPTTIWLTHAAGLLPGLARLLSEQLNEQGTTIRVLPADAGGQAAITFAGRVQRGELPKIHLDSSVPLPTMPAPTHADDLDRTLPLNPTRRRPD